MMEKQSYQLAWTIVKRKFVVSTMYRQSSAMVHDMWYFETMAFEWDDKEKKMGAIVEMDDSGSSEDMALGGHYLMVKKMNELSNAA